MNDGASGFRETRSTTSRSPTNRLLREQQHHFGTATRHLLHTHSLFTLSKGISTEQEKVPGALLWLCLSDKGY